jgi:hypothetical protein
MTTEYIACWPDTDYANAKGYENYYSVSLCDENGEIECLGGAPHLYLAWKKACRHAEARGLVAREEDENGQVCDTYIPDSAENEGSDE